MLAVILGEMGAGKTLLSTLYAVKFAEENPNCEIYANYKIKNIDNFHYNPLLFIPFDKLSNSLLIIDDVYALSNLTSITQTIVNKSRKKDITVLITAQYYTMVSKQLRTLAKYKIRPQYNKPADILNMVIIKKSNLLLKMGEEVYRKRIRDAVKYAKKYYDTTETVTNPTDMDIAKEIIKYSDSNDMLESHLFYFSESISKRNRMKKYIKMVLSRRIQKMREQGIEDQEKIDHYTKMLRSDVLNRK